MLGMVNTIFDLGSLKEAVSLLGAIASIAGLIIVLRTLRSK